MEVVSHGRRSIRILLVEDEPDIRELCSCLLRDAGYEVDTASNAQDALSSLRTNQYALLITDYQMPEMNGDALITRTHGLPKAPRTILMSAYPQIGQIAQQCGADAVFHKGDRILNLLSCIAMLLE